VTPHDAARHAWRAGLSLLPVANDGSKRPDVASWREFQVRRPTLEERRGFAFGRHDGFGMIAGAVSGYREAWDFDCADVYQAFVAMAATCELGDVVQRLIAGYEDETPAGGRRWIVRYPETVDWHDCTLARRPGRAGEPKVKTLIELPTFAILAPSNGMTHPSGKPYVHRSGDFASIAQYTVDERDGLIVLARSVDQMPRPAAHAAPSTKAHPGDRPGDDYNRRMTWPQILEPAGWTHVYDRDESSAWCRPGKPHGISATTNYGGADLLFVFTSSTAFDPEKSYTKFAAYAVLEHGGDYKRAALALSQQGYGRQDDTTTPPTMSDGTLPAAAMGARRAVLTRVVDIEARQVDWLWVRRKARGLLNLTVGDPGLGKTWMQLDMGARISRGARWPDGGQAPLGDVILLSAEDHAAFTLRPRLDMLGADLSRIHILSAVRTDDDATTDCPFSLASDLALLEEAIEQTGAIAVFVDPINAYFGTKHDSYKDTHIRAVLHPLSALAERRNVCVDGTMHLTKATDRRALYRVLGGVGFVASARVALVVAQHPNDDAARVLLPLKQNICAPADTLAFTLTDGRLTWQTEPVIGLTADVVLGASGADQQARREAGEWLQDLLADGPVLSTEIESAARQAGFSRRTLFRAKDQLRISADRVGGVTRGSGRWYWSLPGIKSATPSPVHKLAPLIAPPTNSADLAGVSIKSATVDDADPSSALAPLNDRDEDDVGRL
jgi:hypothetical protein